MCRKAIAEKTINTLVQYQSSWEYTGVFPETVTIINSVINLIFLLSRGKDGTPPSSFLLESLGQYCSAILSRLAFRIPMIKLRNSDHFTTELLSGII